MSPAKKKTSSPKKKIAEAKKPVNKPRARAKPRKKPSAPAAPAENARALALAQKMAKLVLDKKALEVVILDVRGMTSYADYFVIASGESERQVTAMADSVEDKLREEKLRPIGTEGQDTGHWVLLDYGEVVGHFFHQEQRQFYDLEGLWADAPREAVS
jgi:ribosome-associated protein